VGLICFGTNLLESFALATRIYTPTTPRGHFSYAEPLIYFGTNERRRAASGLCVFAYTRHLCVFEFEATKSSMESAFIVNMQLKNIHNRPRNCISGLFFYDFVEMS